MVQKVVSFSTKVVVDVESIPEPSNLGMEFRIQVGEVMDVFADLGLADGEMEDGLRLILNLREQRRNERRHEVARTMG